MNSNVILKKIVVLLLFGNFYLGLNAQCTAFFGVSADSQNNGMVYLYDSSVYTSQYMRYIINWGDGQTEQQYPNNGSPSYSHSYTMGGSYNVCLSIADSIDTTCAGTYCTSLMVSTSNSSCSGYFIPHDSAGIFYFLGTVNGGPATVFHWDFGNGDTSNVQEPGFYTYSAPGDYIVCFSASTPSTSCSFTYCDTVNVPSCAVSFTYIKDSTGGGVTFSSTVTGTADTYLWTFGDGQSSTSANPYHVYTTNGYYTVCLNVTSSTDSICSSTSCNTVDINGFCEANFGVVQDSANGSHFWVLNYGSNSNTNYYWDFGDGDTSNVQYPSHNYATPGPYYLCLTVSDNNGCVDSMCDSIQAVFRNGSPLSITVIEPSSLGVFEMVRENVSMNSYPNPVQGRATVNYSISVASDIELVVFDLLGNRVTQLEKSYKTSGQYSVNWNTQDLSNGLYFLKLRTSSQELLKKVVVSQ